MGWVMRSTDGNSKGLAIAPWVAAFVLLLLFFQNCGTDKVGFLGTPNTKAECCGNAGGYSGKIYVALAAAACSDGSRVAARVAFDQSGRAWLNREGCASIEPREIPFPSLVASGAEAGTLSFNGLVFFEEASPVSKLKLVCSASYKSTSQQRDDEVTVVVREGAGGVQAQVLVQSKTFAGDKSGFQSPKMAVSWTLRSGGVTIATAGGASGKIFEMSLDDGASVATNTKWSVVREALPGVALGVEAWASEDPVSGLACERH